jgi:hypothetical protein
MGSLDKNTELSIIINNMVIPIICENMGLIFPVELIRYINHLLIISKISPFPKFICYTSFIGIHISNICVCKYYKCNKYWYNECFKGLCFEPLDIKNDLRIQHSHIDNNLHYIGHAVDPSVAFNHKVYLNL